MNKTPFFSFLKLLSNCFAFIFGNISWSCPPWVKLLCKKITANPRMSLKILAIVAGVACIVGYGYHWYTHRPIPLLVTAQVQAPNVTQNDKVLIPDTLKVNFTTNKDSATAVSVAPLKLIGKEVTAGIELTPKMSGKWVWESDSRLVFTPEKDWPAAQHYVIHFDKQVFASHVKMEGFKYDFSTQPFVASIQEFKFYQDPIDPKVHQAVATVHFNYPVDSASFEKNTNMKYEVLKDSALNVLAGKFKLTFTYDANKRIAYVHSENLSLPSSSRFLDLNIEKGIKTLDNAAETAADVSQNVEIPDAGSYFKVKRAKISVIRNEQDRSEQVLLIETTLGVTDAELTKHLHVYLLPNDYPALYGEPVKKDYSWENPGEVTAEVLKVASDVSLAALPSDRDYATLHGYKINVPANHSLYVELDKGTQGFGEFVLANKYKKVINAPEYPKEIGFLHKGSLLALSGEKKLSVVTRGVPAVKFEIARVLPDDVNQLVTQSEGRFNNPQFNNANFNQNNIAEIFSEIKNFNSDPTVEQYTAIDLGKYLSAKANTGGPQGLFLLKATAWDEKNKVALDTQTSRLILITDLALITKDNSDGSHDVYVASITKGTPAVAATVSVLGKNGVSVLTRTTDADGRAHFPTLKDFTDEREPTAYLASQGNDVSFMPYEKSDRHLNFSKYDIGGIYNDAQSQTLSAYLFSDRGIYRPGDAAHLGMIVKQAYAQPQPAGLPLEITITDPNGTTIRNQQLTLDATGLLTLDFSTTPTAPTGTYHASLYIVKDGHADNLLGSTDFRVEEFQPDRMRIAAHFSLTSPAWVSPNDLSAQVVLTNLYGTPAEDRRVKGSIVLSPQHIQFAAYRDYTFIDPLRDPKKPQQEFSDTLSEVKTNSDGQADFDLNLERFNKATYQLTFSAEGFELASGRSVSTEMTTLVSPLAFMVGYKADSDLNYIKQNAQHNVNLIAINQSLKQQTVDHLQIKLSALNPVSTLVKNSDGTYKYQTLIQTKAVSTSAFTIADSGTNYTLPTNQVGNYLVEILDQNNVVLSHFNYSVMGASPVALTKNAELSVKLNKADFAPGEDIELQITAPYTGSGLITIERDKVYATQWFKADTTSSIQKIRVPSDFRGNGYVNVAFVRDWNSPEIFVNPLSYSLAPFSVSHEDQTIHIDLDVPTLAMPGSPFTINYKTDKPGKLIIFAVDEGILQVAKYKTPDPLKFFFQKHALEVVTQQTVDQILPQFIATRELSSVGGDGADEKALSNHLNPFKRKTDLPVVYWSGIIDADPQLRQVVYQVPDYFNGSLRVMAVAVAPSALGSSEKTAQIRGNFVISPNVPTFAAPNDEFDVTATVANNVKDSGKDAKVDVQLAVSSGLEIEGKGMQTLHISEGKEQAVHYKVHAKDILGSAQVDFVARSGDKSSKMSATLSIRPVSNYLTTTASGYSTDANKILSVDRVMYPELRKVNAVASVNPLILLIGLQQYLDNYPYGCTEQLVSKVFPLVVLGNQSWFVHDSSLATQKMTATIQQLALRQMSNGGFSYWPGQGEYSSNSFASVYALHFLTEAKAQGYDVPPELLRAGMGYLKSLAQQNVTNMDDARIQAYAIYVLTRNEMVTTNYITHLQLYLEKDKTHAWEHDIISAYLAATYQLLKNDKEANRLIAGYSPKTSHQYEGFYDDDTNNAEYLYLLARHFPEQLKTNNQDLVMKLVTAANSDSINTVFASFTALAFDAYAKASLAANNSPLSIEAIFADGQKQVLPTPDSTYLNVALNDQVKKVSFNNSGKQLYFYQLSQAGFDAHPKDSILKNNLEVYREYKDAKGNIVNHIALGDEVEVHIHIRSLNNQSLSNVALVDLLPGGFEVVRDSIDKTNIDYADVREDRVVFYSAVNDSDREIVYKIKADSEGQFTAPGVFAESMYDPTISARGLQGQMVVR